MDVIDVVEELKMIKLLPEFPKRRGPWKVSEQAIRVEYRGRLVNLKKLWDVLKILKKTRVWSINVEATSDSLKLWSENPKITYNIY